MKMTPPLVFTLVFMVLKLTGVIAWSWWWVTCPMWGSVAVIVIFVAFIEIIKACESPKQRAARTLRELVNALEKKSK